MRRLSLCMWTILALLFLASSGTGQERYPGTSKSWLPRFLQFRRPAASTTVAPSKPAAQAPAPVAPIPTVKMANPKAAEALRQREQANWERRSKVCDELRAIAFQTGDADLERKADHLNQRAWETYCTRTGTPLPTNNTVVSAGDENNLIAEYLRSSKAQQNPNLNYPYGEQRVRANEEDQP